MLTIQNGSIKEYLKNEMIDNILGDFQEGEYFGFNLFLQGDLFILENEHESLVFHSIDDLKEEIKEWV